jgi:SAM-dependent methyltransferase
MGSGTGKHGRLLAAHGYSVHGIERSAEMVAQSPVVPGFSCQQGDICTIRMGRTYDAVLSLFHVLSYQIGNDSIQAVFDRATEHLSHGGLFVFDFWYSPAVYTQRPATRVKRMSDDRVEVTRIAEPRMYPNENRVDVEYTIYAREKTSESMQTLSELHPMRHFSLPEIDLFADAAGFIRVGAEEFLTANAPSENTWGVCVILKKKLI